jgi:CheY-like chemotaxis protein
MPKTIIIIDDDADTRTYLSTILLRGGYKVLTAGDGQEGWNLIQEHTPDLILLDMMMPRKSGLNLLNEVKTNPQFSSIPVIVVSGIGQMTGVDMQRYLADKTMDKKIKPGAFLEKPVKPEKLLKIVSEFLME